MNNVLNSENKVCGQDCGCESIEECRFNTEPQPVPVREDVEKAANNYILTSPYRYTSLTDIFKAGAEWQQKQFMELENIKAGFFIRKGEEINTFLIAALRCLSEEQMIILRDCLIERTPPLKQQASNVWVKASERLPDKIRVNVKYRGDANVIYKYENKEWVFDDYEGMKVFPEDWKDIEWLDEQPINEESKIYKAIEWCQTKIKECDGFRDVASRSRAATLIEVKKYLQSLK